MNLIWDFIQAYTPVAPLVLTLAVAVSLYYSVRTFRFVVGLPSKQYQIMPSVEDVRFDSKLGYIYAIWLLKNDSKIPFDMKTLEIDESTIWSTVTMFENIATGQEAPVEGELIINPEGMIIMPGETQRLYFGYAVYHLGDIWEDVPYVLSLQLISRKLGQGSAPVWRKISHPKNENAAAWECISFLPRDIVLAVQDYLADPPPPNRP